MPQKHASNNGAATKKTRTSRRGPLPKKVARARDHLGKSKALPKTKQIEHPDADTTPPFWLGKVSREKWVELATGLRDQGLLSTVDRDALALYCEAYAEYLSCQKIIDKEGMTLEGRYAQIAHPAVSIRNRAQNTLKQYAIEFGMTPAARSRVTIDEQDTTDEKTKRIFGD